jgi:uncharacterized cupin superfamily protein
MATTASFAVSSTATEEFEPFVFEGTTLGRVHWLRTSGSGDGMLLAGIWASEPMTFPYGFPGDESFQVLEGSLRIELESGETIELKEGDLASFAKGTPSTWTITSPFRKFFVITG